MITTETIQAVAKELADAFTTDTRNDGTTFHKFADDAPEWITEKNEDGAYLSHRIHQAIDGRLPDDWVYEHASYIADRLTEFEDIDAMRDAAYEIAGNLVDVYSSARLKWLASNLNNVALCDEAVEEIGYDKEQGILGMIAAGQLKALEALAMALVTEIENEATRREETAD